MFTSVFRMRLKLYLITTAISMHQYFTSNSSAHFVLEKTARLIARMWIACLGVDPSVFYDVPGEQIESLSNEDGNAATTTVSHKAATPVG